MTAGEGPGDRRARGASRTIECMDQLESRHHLARTSHRSSPSSPDRDAARRGHRRPCARPRQPRRRRAGHRPAAPPARASPMRPAAPPAAAATGPDATRQGDPGRRAQPRPGPRADPEVVDALWPLLTPELTNDDAGAANRPVVATGASSHGCSGVTPPPGCSSRRRSPPSSSSACRARSSGWGRSARSTSPSSASCRSSPGGSTSDSSASGPARCGTSTCSTCTASGWTSPQHLPQPPVNSVYYRDWFDGRRRDAEPASEHLPAEVRRLLRAMRLAIRRGLAGQEREPSSPSCSPRSSSPSAGPPLLWNGTFAEDPTTTLEMLGFGFLGAYVFDVQMLARRFFQSDLKPSAYTSAVLRVVVVLIIVLVMHQLPLFSGAASGERSGRSVRRRAVPDRRVASAQPARGRSCAGAVPTLRSQLPAERSRGTERLVRGPPARGGHRGHAEPGQRQHGRRPPAHPGARRPARRLARPGAPLSPPPPAPQGRPTRRAHPRRAGFVRRAQRDDIPQGVPDRRRRSAHRCSGPTGDEAGRRRHAGSDRGVPHDRPLLHDDPALRPILAWRDREGATPEQLPPPIALAPDVAADERRSA